MTTFLGWLQLACVIVVAGMLVGAAVTTLTTRLGLGRLRALAPRPRFALLATLVALPVLFGGAALAIGFAPSVLDAAGLVQDHCAHHSHHAFHLCFVHDTPPPASGVLLGGALVLTLWLVAGWSERLGGIRRAGALMRSLDAASERNSTDEVRWVDTDRPIAMTLGLVRPRVFISTTLQTLLSNRQLEAVRAHEEAHARRYDALVKIVARLAAELLPPGVARDLLDEMDVACEQACDQAAARRIGDPLTVAEAILTVERASGRDPLPAPVMGFTGDVIEARVKALVDPMWTSMDGSSQWSSHWSSHRGVWAGVAAVGMVALAGSYDSLHHAFETALSLLF